MTNAPHVLVYFAPVGQGGLAKYAVFQAAALASTGVRVVFLGREHMREELERHSSEIEFVAISEPRTSAVAGKFRKAVSWVSSLRSEISQLVELVEQKNASHVLFASFAEYFSPFWVSKLKRLRSRGVRFGTVVHDPVRDFRIGPDWWHQYCISKAYSFSDVAFLHDDTQPDLGRPKRTLRMEIIPHGPYKVAVPTTVTPKAETRDQLGIPNDARVLLSFGHIRDGKNLQIAIAAIRLFPDVHLLVVGNEQSASQHSVAYYQQAATQHQVAKRCHWVNRFVPDDEVYQYFTAADYLLLLYSSDFRSASGVLNNGVQFKLPVLASSGPSPLKNNVTDYDLGEFVEPDSEVAAIDGLRKLLARTPSGRWAEFARDHSWKVNAETVRSALLL